MFNISGPWFSHCITYCLGFHEGGSCHTLRALLVPEGAVSEQWLTFFYQLLLIFKAAFDSISVMEHLSVGIGCLEVRKHPTNTALRKKLKELVPKAWMVGVHVHSKSGLIQGLPRSRAGWVFLCPSQHSSAGCWFPPRQLPHEVSSFWRGSYIAPPPHILALA